MLVTPRPESHAQPMTTQQDKPQADSTAVARRNLPILAGQGAFNMMAWSMASPSIVLTFLAVSLDLPIFLAGLLVSIRHGAGTLGDIFVSASIARLPRKKGAIICMDIAVAVCFLLVIVVTLQGDRTATIAAFVIAIFLIGVLEEIKAMLIIDFVSDNVDSRSRMHVSYLQKAIGGAGTIALVLLVHQLMQDAGPLSRHSTVVMIGVLCFLLSALSMLAFREIAITEAAAPEPGARKPRALTGFFSRARDLFAEPWFRRFMVIRMSFVVVGLSVPFFALIAAEAHHTSAKGLTALIISSSAAVLVATPLWRVLNGYSLKLVMAVAALMVALTGCALVGLHYTGVDHDIHLHAASLFLVTIAVTGLGGARSLYFMEVAPKEQRIAAKAVSTSLARIAIVAISAALAAVAHSAEVAWAIVFITVVSFLAAILSFWVLPPRMAEEARQHPNR
ncbi:MFS transporter [Ruegeria sp. 2012CJ41-6]|uniref:MFS transporter n=1 Tax=Ruegeria spongiae TaxID=2942209 RepID=A0ABT0Q2Z4_9RHOB|nr:MFS transporter [Ruegeria spongiae]MCL6284245.1 MFS transporter [Ruegeria spongiae]